MTASITRRGFLKSAAAGAAGLTTANLLSGCAPKIQSSTSDSYPSTDQDIPVILKADRTVETDVVVVGVGTTGIMAAASAAEKGKRVIAVDTSSGLAAGNCVNTTAIWAVESTPQKQIDGYMKQKDAFLHVLLGTNYQSNGEILRKMISESGRAVDFLINNGIAFDYIFAAPRPIAPEDFMSRGGHAYHTYGEERAKSFQKILDDRKVTCMFNTTAQTLLVEEKAVVGVQCKDGDGKIVDIKAKSVIVCTGGFIANMDLVTKYYGGSRILGLGSPSCKGDGIHMAQQAGAQLGKNFAISLNEFGGANEKGKTSKFAYIPGTIEFNKVFQLPIFGGLLVDNQGNRFMDEGKMCDATMFTSEPCLRLGKYYLVVDKAYLDKVSTTPVLDMIPAAEKMVPMLQQALQGVVLKDIYAEFDTAIAEGWGFKADTVEAMAKQLNMTNLAETLSSYNQFCKDGEDTQFYKEQKYLTALESGPYYIAEYQTSSWCSMGGIKTNGNCRALNADGQIIPGLFVAGTDADLRTVPYYQGGSAQGFCVTSGMIAGETAAEMIA